MPTSVETIAAAAPLPLVGRGRRTRSELALIRGAQAGSEADLAALFHRHWPRAYRAAFLIVHDHAAAEDIAQEAFLAAIRHLDRFDRRRRFAPWLGRIVVNRAIDWARARTARRETADAGHEAVVEDATSARAYSPEVLRALAKLAPDHRAVVVLRYVLEFTPGEIARALELPRGTVNSRLRRGLDALEAELREEPRT
ncbi:MAG TPA: RNA polymerase sigma factor [Solirubrobacteraceae bacterium]|nr:RNA polymerase sigma factor [Solirubrobacteraceae bacterium]